MTGSVRDPTPASYKEACARPEVFPRPLVETTAALLRATARAESLLVRSQLWAPVLEKPPLHTGGAHTDRLALQLAPGEVAAVYLAVLAEVLRYEVEGAPSAAARHQLHIVFERWEEYWFSVGAP